MQRLLQSLVPTYECCSRMRMVANVPNVTNVLLPESFTHPSQNLKELEDFRPLDTDTDRIIVLPNILLAGKSDDCKNLGEKKKTGPKCQSPDLAPKPLPPYDYGFCKDPTPPPRMSCPPKAIRSEKGPCCHDSGGGPKTGCKNK